MHTLPQLGYDYNALEPHIDAHTMEIHYTKHHQGYVDKLNAALESSPELADQELPELLKNASKLSPALRNNGGGHYNHSLFWQIMLPNSSGKPEGNLAEAINDSFGSFDKFQEEFSAAAAGRFGSGWAWLIKTDDKLLVTSTPNQDNPLMDVAEVQGTPILGLDVWEHAYYLHYQNKRPDYIAAWWNVVNWNKIGELFAA